MIRRFFLTLVTLFCAAGILLAQDMHLAAGIINKINARYAGVSNWETKVQYTLYRSHTGDEVVQIDSATIVYSNGNTVFQMGGIETVSDGKYDLLIDHNDKVIMVADHNPRLVNPLARFSLDTLLSVCNGFQTSSFDALECLYLGLDGSEASGVSVCYFKSDFSLFALTIYYREERSVEIQEEKVSIKPRLEMRYLKPNSKINLAPQKCTTSWYIKPSGHSFMPTERFKSYRLINQIIGQ